MKSIILYLPIGSASLPHYFNRAIILPAKYYSNKMDDLQNRFTGSVFLSDTMAVAEADCFLEVVLTEKELNGAERIEAGYLINGALPISRVKAVCFLNEEQKDNTVFNINAGTAYLPERLVKIIPALKEPAKILPRPNIRMDNPDLLTKASRFDVLLGGLAFMRLGHKIGFNYPKDYFGTLAFFNTLIREQVLKAEEENLVTYDDWLTGLFSNKKNTGWSEWQSYIYKNVDTELVEKLAAQSKIKLEKKFGVIQLDKVDQDSYLYTLSVLATYGDKTSLSINELVRLLQSPQLSEEKAEELALIFGLHTKYSNLRKEYQSAVKFKLESQLDYYTIESIYQFVYNGVRENKRFEYLDNWIPVQRPIVSENVPHFQILDTDVLSKKKAQPGDFFQERFGEQLKNLQEKFGHLGKEIFDTAYEVAERNSLKEIQKLSVEANYLKQQVEELTKVNKEFEQKTKMVATQLSEPQKPAITSDIVPGDGLEDIELKELKKVAKSRKISSATINLVKPTKKGLEEFINLIRNTPTLL